jgi:hypothetical protein
MRGVVSFHPVDVAFFDEIVGPLWEGGKINPEAYLRDALRLRHVWWEARRFVRGLEHLAEGAAAPEAPGGGNLWQRVRTRLETYDHRPDPRAITAARHFDRDLHARGRPFFVAEGSAERVADAVERYREAAGNAEAAELAREQLRKLDPALVDAVEPVDGYELAADLIHRNDLLKELKEVFDLGRAVASGGSWPSAGGPSRPAAEAAAAEIPFRAVRLHGRIHPFWIGDDVDGLESICRAAGVPAPDCLSPAWRLFAPVIGTVPALRDRLGLELRGPRDAAGLVLPPEVGSLLQFLEDHGARIIQAAARAGEGPAATALLRKIKECAVYASRRGLGYLEASGVEPPDLAEVPETG